MVRKVTFILVLITFFTSHFIFEKVIKKHGDKIKIRQVGLVAIGVEALMIILAAHITFFFYVLIYGTIITASFISVFFRHMQSRNKIFKNAL